MTRNNAQQALRLYVLNTKVSAAVMIDLHYIEVALHNKFDRELAAKFGNEWFKDAGFLALVDGRSHLVGKPRRTRPSTGPRVRLCRPVR